jgi:hypothetical protein
MHDAGWSGGVPAIITAIPVIPSAVAGSASALSLSESTTLALPEVVPLPLWVSIGGLVGGVQPKPLPRLGDR